MLEFEKAVKFQFLDRDWKKKLFPIMISWGIIFLLFLVSFFMMYLVPLFLIGDSSSSTDMNTGPILTSVLGFGCFMMLIGIVSMVANFFLLGYGYEITQNVRHNKSALLPTVAPIGERISKGFQGMLMHLVPMFILGLFYAIFMVIYFVFVGSFAVSSSDASAGGMLIGMFLMFGFMGIWYLLILIYSIFYSPAATYLFLTRGLSKSIFAYGEMFSIVKLAWKEFLMMFGFLMLGSMVLSFAMYIPCIGFLAYPVLFIFLMNAKSHLEGQVFNILDKKLKENAG